jgi:Transcriptional regulator
MNQLEEAVLLATLDEGGNTTIQKFSTIHIAAACGVSEFLIYEHFTSKEHLLDEANRYVAHHFRDELLRLSREQLPFPELFSKLLDYQLKHPSWNGFSLSYGHFFPHYGAKKAEEKRFQEHILESATLFLKSYDIVLEPSPTFEVYCFLLRELFSFAQLLISKEIPDTPKIRQNQANLILSGMQAFWKISAKAA